MSGYVLLDRWVFQAKLFVSQCLAVYKCPKHSCLRSLAQLQGICTVLCSARTCEVYEQRDSEATSYVSTVRGKPTGEAFEHSVTLPVAQKVVLRLLSLQQRGIIHIHSVQLAAAPEISPHNESSTSNSSYVQQHSTHPSSRSQQAEVTAMLQNLMSTG